MDCSRGNKRRGETFGLVKWRAKLWVKTILITLTLFLTQEMHTQAVIEVLQSIRQAEMTPLLDKMYHSEGGVELLDVLMKYL